MIHLRNRRPDPRFTLLVVDIYQRLRDPGF
jgi:hypothetical protein